MAYMNQEKKAVIASAMKPVLKKYGLKATLSVQNHSGITLNIKSGPIDFGGDRIQVNHYWLDDHYKDRPKALAALKEIKKALMAAGYYDNSDAMTDYFDTAYYYYINVGKWNKPHVVVV
jgi:ABC-type proline/glycine betaine transport system substrate-binding protein